MTISITSAACSHTGDGSTVAFDVKDGANGIYFAEASELRVTLQDGSTVTTQTLGTHYSVTGAGSAAGVVTFVTAPADDVTVRIERVTPRTQTLNLTQAGAFSPVAIMGALDKLTRISQELSRNSQTETPLTLNDAGEKWDADSKVISAVATPTASTDAATKGYVDGLIGTSYAAASAASAAEAEAALAEFESLYLGSKTADPSVDNDGNALVEGQFYWNSAANQLKFYDGSAWQAYSGISGVSSVNGDTGAVTLTSTDLTMSATSRVVGRKSASGGASEEVTLSELLDFIGSAAQGDILYRGASSWARLGAGTSGQRLTTGGAGANPSWQTPDEGFPSGTKMLFVQTAAPTGWTKSTTHNDKALRVVSGAASSGGSNTFTAAMVSAFNSGSTTLTSSQMPAHTHASQSVSGSPSSEVGNLYVTDGNTVVSTVTGSTGGGGSHLHTVQLNVAYVDVIMATKD